MLLLSANYIFHQLFIRNAKRKSLRSYRRRNLFKVLTCGSNKTLPPRNISIKSQIGSIVTDTVCDSNAVRKRGKQPKVCIKPNPRRKTKNRYDKTTYNCAKGHHSLRKESHQLCRIHLARSPHRRYLLYISCA